MQIQSSDLFSNFSEELSRRISSGEEGSEYEQEYVDMSEFICSTEYMDLSRDISEANLQLLTHIDNPEIREAWLILGKGSGKSFNSSIYQCRGIWQTAMLRDPQRYSKLAVGTHIYFLNMATNQTQARDIVFTDFIEKLKHSKCFYHWTLTRLKVIGFHTILTLRIGFYSLRILLVCVVTLNLKLGWAITLNKES